MLHNAQYITFRKKVAVLNLHIWGIKKYYQDYFMTSYGKHQDSSNPDLSRFGILTEMHTWKRK